MTPPTSATRHDRRLRRLSLLTLAAVRRAWRRMEPGRNWEQQYREDVGPKLLALVVAAQIAASRESDNYVADVLNELNFGPATTPGVVRPTAFAGWAGDGRPVGTLLEQAVVHAGQVYNAVRSETPEGILSRTAPEGAAEAALESAEAWLDMTVETILADAARAAEEVAMAERPWVAGYVRVAEPDACSRCIILAGKFYLFNDGFLRHPRCRCNHLPAPEDPEKVKALIGVNSPDRYFESLSEDEQNRIFTQAGAEAIRNGADITRVVNARRGMRRAQLFGHDALVTTEATTRRGRVPGQPKGVRLMPETIFAIAGDDRIEAIRLLRLYGFII